MRVEVTEHNERQVEAGSLHQYMNRQVIVTTTAGQEVSGLVAYADCWLLELTHGEPVLVADIDHIEVMA